MRSKCLWITAAALAMGIVVATPAAAQCFNKSTEGTAFTKKAAQFQAFEAVLQSFDWGAWASWMATGKHPGYKITTSYKCKAGGLGQVCRARARVCPTGA